jgi:hypothetical protein
VTDDELETVRKEMREQREDIEEYLEEQGVDVDTDG